MTILYHVIAQLQKAHWSRQIMQHCSSSTSTAATYSLACTFGQYSKTPSSSTSAFSKSLSLPQKLNRLGHNVPARIDRACPVMIRNIYLDELFKSAAMR